LARSCTTRGVALTPGVWGVGALTPGVWGVGALTPGVWGVGAAIITRRPHARSRLDRSAICLPSSERIIRLSL
jgi:hypothetical protein